jgi:hypothetical protein
MTGTLQMVGQHIGKYRVIDRVGRGGMGTVYRAIDETLHREVAIKVLNTELNDPEVARRFRAEAITVARLSHPGIATIYELFQHDGQWLMVMEFVRGETLEQLVARAGPLPPQQAALLCMQSLTALAHAHSMGVVHRDLKPANIMRTESGDIKIMDFGIARVSGTEHMTSVGFMMGTPAYMAPEQVMGQEIDARADLYAMGVVFFRLLTGQLPFKGDTPFAMAQAQVNAPPTPIRTIRADLPAWVADVLVRCLEKKPEDRFQSAVAFHDTLAQAIAGVSGAVPMSAPGVSVGSTAPVPSQPPDEVVATMLSTPATLPSGRVEAATSVAVPVPPPAQQVPGAVAGRVPAAAGRPLWLVGALAAALLLAVAGWWMFSGRGSDPASVPEAPVEAALQPSPEPPPPPAPAEPTPVAPSAPAAAPDAGAAGRAGAAANTPVPAPTTPTTPSAATGRRGAPPAPPVDTAPVVEISNVRVMTVDGRRASDREVTLTLGNGRIVATTRGDDPTTLASWLYGSVTGVTYVYARNPRWNPELASPPDDLEVGGMFRTSRHYMTLQNPTEFVILRLEDINIIQVIRELEARTGLTIRRQANPPD